MPSDRFPVPVYADVLASHAQRLARMPLRELLVDPARGERLRQRVDRSCWI